MKRIQMKRTKGWRKPDNTVYVGRPTKWGNPYHVGEVIDGEQLTQEAVVELFRAAVSRNDPILRFRPDDLELLRGKNLACWCREGTPCHADVLIELANQ